MRYEVVAQTRWMGHNWRRRTLQPGEERYHGSGLFLIRGTVIKAAEKIPSLLTDTALNVTHTLTYKKPTSRTFINFEYENSHQPDPETHTQTFSVQDILRHEQGLIFPQGVTRRFWKSSLQVGLKINF